MIKKNIEGLAKWNIRQPRSRKPGLAALFRLRNEAEFCVAAIESVAGLADSVIICLQGDQEDDTKEIVESWAAGRPEAEVYEYPFLSVPNGPGHGDQPIGSVHERAYFYNWCLSKVRRSHVLKWDGDMIALETFASDLHQSMRKHDYAMVQGYEIVSANPLRLSAAKPLTAAATRVFPAAAAEYSTADFCESLNVARSGPLLPPAYLHTKWIKPEAGRYAAWPEGWQSIPHFVRLVDRSRPGSYYEGVVPDALEHLSMSGEQA